MTSGQPIWLLWRCNWKLYLFPKQLGYMRSYRIIMQKRICDTFKRKTGRLLSQFDVFDDTSLKRDCRKQTFIKSNLACGGLASSPPRPHFET